MIFLRLCFGYLLQIVPFTFLCFYPFDGSFRFSKRKSLGLTASIILGCALIFSSSGTYLSRILPGDHSLFQAVNLIFMFCLMPCFFWYFYLIQDIWQKKLFIFSFTLTCALAITSISNIISTWVYYDEPTDGLPYKGYTTVILFFIIVIFLLLWRLLYQKYYTPIKEALGIRESGHLSILSLLLFIILASGLSFLEYSDFIENPMLIFLYFALLAATLIIYVLYFKMFSSVHEKYLTENRYLKVKYNMQLLDKQYLQLQETIEQSRHLKHDLKHHMLVMGGYLNENKIEEAQAYIQQYLRSLQEFELLKFCDHQIVNMIISHYYTLAHEHDIDFHVHLSLPKELPVANSDLTVLLGNLLENAVNAASLAHKGERYIHLNIILHRKMLAITVDNSFYGDILRDQQGNYLSTKGGHTGMGLSSVSHIAEKYNGGVEFRNEYNTFHSCVMLGLNTK